jgi:exonuclease SbcC
VRPLRIEFQAFGPYPERVEVDLTTLEHRGLFVVAGDTGTGKTTILDAMSYALYGTMPLKDSGEIRSHHAARGDRTEVRLTFQVNGETWVIERSPAQERPAQRGADREVTVDATVVLQQVGEGASAAPLTRVNEVRERIQELVGLSATQFQRVVLLPQAKVTEFLLANSRDREALLEQLFDGRLFDVIVGELKRRADAASGSVDDADRELRSHLSTAARELDLAEAALQEATEPPAAPDPTTGTETEPSPGADDSPDAEDTDARDGERTAVDREADEPDPEDLRDRLEAATPLMTELDRSCNTASNAATEAATALADARTAADRFDRASALRSELSDLTARLPRAAEGAERAQGSRQARPVVDTADRAQRAADAVSSSDERLRLTFEPIERILHELGVPSDDRSPGAIRVLVDGLRTRHQSEVTAITALDTAVAALESSDRTREEHARELAGHQQQADQALGRLTAIDEILPRLAVQAGDPGTLEERVTVAESAITARRKLDEARVRAVEATNEASRLTAVHADVFSRFVATQAPRLAAELVDDEPCPVCGSRAHPDPATTSGGEAVDQSAVDTAASAKEGADRLRMEAEATVERIEAELGASAARSVEELTTELDTARAAVTTAERARVEQEQLAEERRSVEELQNLAVMNATDVSGRMTEAGRQREALATAVETARAAAAGIDRAEIESLTGHLAELGQLLAALDVAANDHAHTAGAHREAAARSAAELDASSFDSVAAARAVVIDIDVEGQLLRDHEEVTTAIAERTGGLQALEEQGVPNERPDVEAAESTSDRTTAAADQLRDRLHRARSALERADQALDRHAELDAGSADARETLELLSRAHTVCKDGGGPKIPLKRWILARELERVTRAANEHLRTMTNGRYSLAVRADASDGRSSQGLGLEVFDAETGKSRSTPSLSGGEQFQASLALALGLADVVSQGGTGSGHRFEALFVDEGFGALDPDALDDAIETLQSLHATGRTIGVITHVEAMKERLHVGIQVERRPDGRGSQLTVRP